MGKKSFRQIIGSFAWWLFLWANETTAEKYWREIYKQEADQQANPRPDKGE